jgi:hypothetical protein
LRLLTVKQADIAKLSDYLTADELASLLVLNIARNSARAVPDTLCALKDPRSFSIKGGDETDSVCPVELEFDLIPQNIFPKSRPDFLNHGFFKGTREFVNVINIVPKMDIYLSSVMFRSCVPRRAPKIKHGDDGDFIKLKQESMIVKFSFSISLNGQEVQCRENFEFNSCQDYGTYLTIPPVLTQDNSYKLNISIKADGGYFDNVPVVKVNKHILDTMDSSIFKRAHFDDPGRVTPLFVSQLGYIVVE